MKKTMKKILALVLTMLMLLSVAAPVFANTAATVECPVVHSKKNLDEKGITYKFISEHKPERCSDQSYNVYQCNACGKYFADDIVLSGTQCDFEITKPATCTEKGTQKCKVCGYEEEIDMVPHNYVPDKTCGYNGEDVTWTCSVCGDKKVAPFDGEHKWEITVTLEPTCNTKGNAHYVCTICGFEKNVPIIADATHIGHTWVYGEGQVGGCFKDGTTKDHITAGYYCKDCGVAAEAGQEIIVNGEKVVNETKYAVISVEHDIDYTKPTTETDATCDTYGFKFYACKICSYVDVDAIQVIPAKGHTFERADFDKSALTPDITSCYVDSTTEKIVPGKNSYNVTCADCGATGTIVDTHAITVGMIQPATCKDPGYTYDYCAICDANDPNFDGRFNKRNETAPVADAHVWVVDEEEAISLNHPEWFGIETAPTCVTPGVKYSTCKVCEISSTKVAEYDTTVPATGHNYTKVEFNCLTGVITKTCEICPEGTANKVVETTVENYDFNDLTNHEIIASDYLAEADCTTAGVELYICKHHPEKAITIVTAPKHDIDQTTYVPATPATCTTDGHVGYEKCTKCDYEKGTAGAEGVIPALGHTWNEETAIEALAPTCTEKGNYAWKECTVCGAEEGSKDEIPALGHDINLIDDINDAANNGTAWGFTCSKYAYNHYGCTRCNDKTTEYWEKYVAATGHNMEVTTEPTCTTDGEKTCTNAWCDGCLPEIVPMLKHIDENEKVIECVSEDFYCFRCCEPKFDADEKFTGEYAKDKHSWKESHYNTAVTIVSGICTEYHYVLYVCTACETEWMVGEAGLDQHLNLDPNRENDALWIVLPGDEATFDAAGTKSLICGRPGCNAVVDEKEYTRDDIELSFTFENYYGKYDVVNSGYLAVKVNLAGYQQKLNTISFSFTVDFSLVELVGVEVANNDFYNMVFASHDVANKNRVNVLATVQNAADGTQREADVNGSAVEFVTLVFKVADLANTERTEPNTEKAIASFRGITAAANKLDETPIVANLVGADHDETIHILGDVNDDGLRNNGKVATDIDIIAMRKAASNNEYIAEADIDKDGEITADEFRLLAQYIVGVFDYEDLCANDLSKFA